MSHAAPVFVDRDGVINANRPDYVRNLSQWVPLPGAFVSLARLCRASHPVVVVTNQSGIGRGLFTEEDLLVIHRRMTELLHREGGGFAGVYHCPHTPEEGCSCRKPRVGMIRRARRELGLPSGGWMVGDALTDVEMGFRAGLRTVLVLSGRGAEQWNRARESGAPEPYAVVPDLSAAVDRILADSRT